MSVHLDGSTLTALLFSHMNSNGNQYGFLTGEKIEHIEDKISDSQIHTYDVNSYIYVSSFVPWSKRKCAYNRGGHISDEWVQQICSDKEQNFIGWYSFRHNTTTRPSLRETSLHKNLTALERFSGQDKDFLFFLCTSSSSANMSIHMLNYSFMRIKDGRFHNLPITVMNLGDTTRKEYRKRSNATLTRSKTIQGSLQNFHKHFLRTSGDSEQVVKVKNLASSMDKSLMSVHGRLAESETTLGLLEADVNDLRQQLNLLEEKEIETMFQIQAENKRKEIEERKKDDAREEAEEQEQLEKLLIDLGMPPKDIHYSTSVTYNLQPEQFTSENCSNVQSLENVQVRIPTPSYSKERAFVNNNDLNTSCVDGSISVTLPVDKHTHFEQGSSVNGAENSINKTIDVQTMKISKSEPFSFIEEELKLNQISSVKKPQATNSRGSTNTIRVRNQSGYNSPVLDVDELSHSNDGFIRQDIQNERSPLKYSTPLKNTSDSVKETSGNIDMGTLEDQEISQSDLHVCDENIVVSSSPVF